MNTINTILFIRSYVKPLQLWKFRSGVVIMITFYDKHFDVIHALSEETNLEISLNPFELEYAELL